MIDASTNPGRATHVTAGEHSRRSPPMSDLAFGLDTFGDVPEDDSGTPVSDAQAIRQVVDEAVLAEEAGVDVLDLGEHHRPESAISTPETVLAGIATRTSRIRLSSGVTVLSSDHSRPPYCASPLVMALRRAVRRLHVGDPAEPGSSPEPQLAAMIPAGRTHHRTDSGATGRLFRKRAGRTTPSGWIRTRPHPTCPRPVRRSGPASAVPPA